MRWLLGWILRRRRVTDPEPWVPERHQSLKGFRQPKGGAWQLEWVNFRSPLPEAPRIAFSAVAWKAFGVAMLLAVLGRLLPWEWAFYVLPIFGLNELVDTGSFVNDPAANVTKNRECWTRVNSFYANQTSLNSRTINAGANTFSAGATTEARITLAIAQAVAELSSAVYVPRFMQPYDATLVTFNNNIRMVSEGGNHSVYEPEAYGAKGDNVRNDYANVQACINAAATRGTVVLNRMFRCSSMVTLPSATELVGLGWFTGLRFDWLLNTGQGGPVYLGNADQSLGNTNIRLRDFTFRGAHPGGPLGDPGNTSVSGMLFRIGTAVQVRNMQIEFIPGVSLSHQGITDFKASGNYVHDGGRDAITGGPFGTSPSDDVTINDNTLVNCHDDMIACNMSVDTSIPGTTPPRRWLIEGNLLRGGASLSADNFARGIMVHGGEDITITGNQIHDTSWSSLLVIADPVTGQRPTRIVVVGNKFRRAGQVGTNLGGNGCTMTNINDLTFIGNEVSDSKNYGLLVQDVNGFTITDNTVLRCSSTAGIASFGVWLDGTAAGTRNLKNGIFARNRVAYSTGAGVFCRYVNQLDLFDNQCYNNGLDGAADSRNAGICIEGAGILRVHGNRCYDDQVVKTQRIGIATRVTAIDDLSLQDNDLRGNNVTPLTLNITPTVFTRRGNHLTAGALSGRAALVNGTVTVSTAEVQTADNISLTCAVAAGTTRGVLTVGTIVAGTSFVINATDLAGAFSADDDSTVFWEICH